MGSVYAVVDPVIRAWVEQRGFDLMAEFNGEARFFYLPGGPQECFQISINPPFEGQVMVNAWTVETIDDAEMHDVWCVPEAEIDTALDHALAKVREWMSRPKGPPTWTPHWKT